MRIKNFGDMLQHLIAACLRQKAAGLASFRVELLYSQERLKQETNGGGYVTLDEDDLSKLQNAAGKQ